MEREGLQDLEDFYESEASKKPPSQAFQAHRFSYDRVIESWRNLDENTKDGHARHKKLGTENDRGLGGFLAQRRFRFREKRRRRRRRKRAATLLLFGAATLALHTLLSSGGDGGAARGRGDQALETRTSQLGEQIVKLSEGHALQDQELGKLRTDVTKISDALQEQKDFTKMMVTLESARAGMEFNRDIYMSALDGKVHMKALDAIEDLDSYGDQLLSSLLYDNVTDVLIPKTRLDWLSCPTSLTYGDGYFALILAVPLTAADREMDVYTFNGSPVMSGKGHMTLLTESEVRRSSLIHGNGYFGIMSPTDLADCNTIAERYLYCPKFSHVTWRIPKVVHCSKGRPRPELCLLSIFTGDSRGIQECCSLERLELEEEMVEVFRSAADVYQIFSGSTPIDFTVVCDDGSRTKRVMTSGESLEIPRDCAIHFFGGRQILQIGRGLIHAAANVEAVHSFTEQKKANAEYTSRSREPTVQYVVNQAHEDFKKTNAAFEGDVKKVRLWKLRQIAVIYFKLARLKVEEVSPFSFCLSARQPSQRRARGYRNRGKGKSFGHFYVLAPLHHRRPLRRVCHLDRLQRKGRENGRNCRQVQEKKEIPTVHRK